MPPAADFKETMFAGGLVATDDRPIGLLHELRVQITPEDLKTPAARTVFAAAQIATASGVSPTSGNLAQLVIAHGLVDLHNIGDDVVAISEEMARITVEIDKLSQIGAKDGNSLNSLAGIIWDQCLRERYNQFVAVDAPKIINSPMGSANDIHNKLVDTLQAYQPNHIRSSIYSIDDQTEYALSVRQEQAEMVGKKMMTFPPVFDDICDVIPWLEPANMYILGGTPGSGKSTALDQTAEHNVRAGFKVAYFHLEDSTKRKIWRRTIRLTGCTLAELKAGDPRGMEDKANLIVKSWKKSGGELWLVHCPGQNAKWIHSVVSQLKPNLVIIDYGQKLNLSSHKGDNEAAALAQAVDECKEIAEDPRNPCAVILGSQVSDYNGAVSTYGSRSFEQKGQAIILIHRRKLTDEDQPEIVDGVKLAGPGEQSIFAKIAVTKNNDGGFTESWLLFLGSMFKFEGLKYRAWKRLPGNADKEPNINTLRRPVDQFYADQEVKAKAYSSADKVLEPPKTKGKGKGRSDEQQSYPTNKLNGKKKQSDPIDLDDVPF